MAHTAVTAHRYPPTYSAPAPINSNPDNRTGQPQLVTRYQNGKQMPVPTSQNEITSSSTHSVRKHGVSAVTVALMLAAMAVVTLTILQAVSSAEAATTQVGIPGLIG